MRRVIVIAAFVCMSCTLVAVAVNGCTDRFPKEGYCHLGDIAALAPPGASKACEACLTEHTNCCDSYGACEDAGASCTETFSHDFACVLDAGTLGHTRESTCLGDASGPATIAYGCVKDNCAEPCGIAAAACTPDPAIPRVANPECDFCATGSCCTSLNACYRLRPCKLTFECVLMCGKEVTALYDTSDAGAGLLGALSTLCDAGQAAAPSGLGDLPCVTKCFLDFTKTSENQQEGACATLALFGCTYGNCRAGCGLNVPGDGIEAGVTDAAGD